MQTIGRSEWARRRRDGWRLACPEGHRDLSLNSGSPVLHGRKQPEQVRRWVYDTTGGEYRGQMYCETCERSYFHTRDLKADEDVVLEPDVQFVEGDR